MAPSPPLCFRGRRPDILYGDGGMEAVVPSECRILGVPRSLPALRVPRRRYGSPCRREVCAHVLDLIAQDPDQFGGAGGVLSHIHLEGDAAREPGRRHLLE